MLHVKTSWEKLFSTLFHTKTIHTYDSLHGGFLVSICLGMFPMFPTNKKNGVYKLASSKNLHFITFTYVMFITFMLCTAFEAKTNSGTLESNFPITIVRFGIFGVIIFGCVAVYVIYATSFVFKDHVMSVYETLASIDRMLEKAHIKIEYARYRKYEIASIISLAILSPLMNWFIYDFTHDRYSGEVLMQDFSFWSVITFPVTISNFFAAQVSILGYNFYVRYKLINNLLENMDAELKQAVSKTEGQDYDNKKLKHLLITADRLSNAHYQLSQSATALNNYLYFAVLAIVFHQFCLTTFSVFHFCYMHSTMPFSSACWLSWGTLKFFEVLQITVSCHLAKRESEITGRRIHKILIHNRNKEIENKLMVFSNQVLQQKFSFTLAGLMNVDATLLFNMIGASTTYLVILIQFQEASTPPDCRQFLNSTIYK